MHKFDKMIRARALRFGRYRYRKYKITDHLFEELLARQGGVCGICGDGDPNKLVIDHCHRTKRVRGLLCNTCNLAIAYFKDDPALMHKAIAYLKQGERS